MDTSYLLQIFTSAAKQSDSLRFDNAVVGIPVISCERDRIRIEIETTRPFGGKVFVKGEYANRQCVRSYVDGIPSSPHGYPAFPEYDKVRLKNRKTTAKVGDTRLDNVHSKWPEHSAVNSTTEESTGNKNTTPNSDSSGSAWLGYGGVSAYLGAFGGSHKENIYSKSKSHEANNLPNLQHSGSQGLISLNCPEKCEPCVCAKEEQPQERKRRTTNHVELSVPLGACNAKRDRKLSPPTLAVSFVAVISFHESFITKLDRAYHIQCAYMEINKTLSTQINIGQEETSNVNGTAMPPVCDYHISSSDGRPIQSVHVGERVKHVWNCTTTVPKLYSMLVHSCFIEDGAGQRYEKNPTTCSELPQHLASSQTSWIPIEFCLSVAGFGILVSASTFLTTVTIGIALANIYMKSYIKYNMTILHVYRGDDDIRRGARLLFFFVSIAKKARKSVDVRDRWKAQR
ncbi:unnamed protein product [Angiostrongylus costaricensis]|uniref:ZP domain-containing protein n=1 Tax=Angiostrongylus costaricensis TaxID=334426 RepID=A0A3P7HDD3_ANGCS|nr:unnamed protein product [Angiostrongylus costaricensis]